MNSVITTAEELRQQGLSRIKMNQIEEALPLFDQALALAEDDELAELITINKAGALIAMQQSGPEVQKLPQIIMRRRNLRHLYLAAYNLEGKYEADKEFARAAFYGKVALNAAEEAGEIGWKTQALIVLGNACVFDSRSEEAVSYYEHALELLEPLPQHAFRRGAAMQNLGYCRLLDERYEDGISLIHSAVALLREAGAEGYVGESYIDLCYGYLGLEQLGQAKHYGSLGLEAATEVRQVRNAHYLLGEVAHKQGDMTAAEFHFDHLATFYPDFPHLKHLLHALDLRAMVNLKL